MEYAKGRLFTKRSKFETVITHGTDTIFANILINSVLENKYILENPS